MSNDPNDPSSFAPPPSQSPAGDWQAFSQGAPGSPYQSPQSQAYGPPYGYAAPPSRSRMNGLGVASLVLSLLSALVLIISIGGATAMVFEQRGHANPEAPEMVVLGLAMLGAVGMQFIAFVLGVIALFLPNRGKIAATLGVVFSGLAIAMFVGLMIVGMTAQM